MPLAALLFVPSAAIGGCGGLDCAGTEIACGDDACDGATELCESYTGGFDGTKSTSCRSLEGCEPGDCECVGALYTGTESADCRGTETCETRTDVSGS